MSSTNPCLATKQRWSSPSRIALASIAVQIVEYSADNTLPGDAHSASASTKAAKFYVVHVWMGTTATKLHSLRALE